VTSCSVDALDAHEPLAGTAPYATAWIVIEQPGPWGRDALTDSRLDARIAQHLGEHKGTGVSVLLARHADRPERAPSASRHVWVARSMPGGLLMRHAEVDSLEALLDWDLATIGQGSLPPFGSIVSRPVQFICTHSGRDRCCAVHGRALVQQVMAGLDAEARLDVWECSHIGGHRFAPVCLTLPLGTVHGRLDLASALAVHRLAPSGGVVLDRLRGRSSLLPPSQVAAIEVQANYAVESIDALDVLRVSGGVARSGRPPLSMPTGIRSADLEVRHVDGRAWRATVVARDLERDRMESCGKPAVPGVAWSCVSLAPTDAWI
jgi:hypothetical protein